MIDRKKIENEAEKILALPFVAGQFPVPAEKIVEHFGYECYLFDPNNETISVAGVVDHQKKKVFINKKDMPQRQLFTLAHELGHIVMHNDGKNYVDYRNTLSFTNNDGKECEANYFAAALLMPKEIFTYQWVVQGSLNKLSRFFGVSPSAVAVRADSLNLS